MRRPDFGMRRPVMDLVAFGPDDEPVLLVEVNRMLNATPEWAARFRQNMIDHGRLAATKFFLFALPDRFFLWQGSNGPSPLKVRCQQGAGIDNVIRSAQAGTI